MDVQKMSMDIDDSWAHIYGYEVEKLMIKFWYHSCRHVELGVVCTNRSIMS